MLVSSQCNRAAVSPPAPLLPVFAPLLAVPRCVPAKRPCRGNAPALGTAPEPDLCVYGNTERGMGQTLPACLITEFLPGIFALVIRHFPHFVNNMIDLSHKRNYYHQHGSDCRGSDRPKDTASLVLAKLSFSSWGLAETPGGMLRNWSKEMKAKWMIFVSLAEYSGCRL